MTPKQLFSNLNKLVTINERGKRAFSDSDGEFYLVGAKIEYLTIGGKRQASYCGIISRTFANRSSRAINVDYLELVQES